MAEHILGVVTTRGRYGTTLPLTLAAIAAQTRPPDTFLLVDDNPEALREDLGKHPVLTHVLNLLVRRCKTYVVAGTGRGPHANHEMTRTCVHAKSLIWRVDDDEVPEPNVLEKLEQHLTDPAVGAVAGAVWGTTTAENRYADSSLEAVPCRNNVQWYTWPEGTVFPNCGHLHSTYLYRKDAAPFPQHLSPVGHTEETRHTIGIRLFGKRLVVDPSAITWHLQQPAGGIRNPSSRPEMWAADELDFRRWLRGLKTPMRWPVDLYAHQGLGDAWALCSVLPKILEQYKDRDRWEVRLWTAPPNEDVFAEFRDRLMVLRPSEAGKFPGVMRGPWNVYGWMQRSGFRGQLPDALLQFYRPGRQAEEDEAQVAAAQRAAAEGKGVAV